MIAYNVIYWIFSMFRQQLKVNNNLLIQQNEEQFAIEEQVQQVQVRNSSQRWFNSNKTNSF